MTKQLITILIIAGLTLCFIEPTLTGLFSLSHQASWLIGYGAGICMGLAGGLAIEDRP